MSQARMDLQLRLLRLSSASYKEDINPKPATYEEWNERARLLKIGIALGVFTALEDFIKRRIIEILQKIEGLSPSAKALPPTLITALTVSALKTASGRVGLSGRHKVPDVRAFVLEQARKISSIGGALIIPSELALANNNSNVSWEVLEDALNAFGVENANSVMGGVSKRIDGGIFAAKDHFETASILRHQVAHEPCFDIPVGDVLIHLRTGAMICCAFDVVLSTAASKIIDGVNLAHPPVTANKDLKIIFVEQVGAKWRHKNENSTRGKVSENREMAFQRANAEGKKSRACVVSAPVDAGSPCTSWVTPFL